ncbi:hypothetical protein, partial [Rhodoferax sp.]|uniref:hypothetical protein n=1 Tax=Rhodoferax sp. TaxID=50421 RepID=UPI002ACE396B
MAPGIKVVDVQSVTTADVYVTRGKANRTALTPSGKKAWNSACKRCARNRCEAVCQGRRVLFGGKALADVSVDFFRGSLEGAIRNW